MPNRLASSTSPYLLQHKDNPVDWQEWGDDAFAEAKARDVPVLLSVGYAACHWCHVMAHESFEDPATAELMNEHFVNIKVDREERPDVDAVYMDAVQSMTGIAESWRDDREHVTSAARSITERLAERGAVGDLEGSGPPTAEDLDAAV